jgi:hypothetical protein
MNVVCIKSSKRLVKNATYRVAYLNNQNTKGYSHFTPTVRIYLTDNSIQTFPLSSFKPEVGPDFANIQWFCPDHRAELDLKDQMKIDKRLKAGDYVVPNYDNLKTLIRGRKYKVKEVNFTDHKSSLGATTWTDIKIKLEGSQRWYIGWNFRKCSNQETREISLSSLFDESTGTETVNKHRRKFDYFTEEEKKVLLLKFVVSASNDRYRNSMDIIDWTIDKTASQYSLNRTDFELISDLKMLEILNLIK